jgi:2-phospho-L-lactate guanylyltransferase
MWIIVPIKKFADAKTRLADLLLQPERRILAETLAKRVLGHLARSRYVQRVIVASSEPALKDSASRFGLELLADDPLAPGLNGVVDRAVGHALASGGTDVGVVFSDLPLFDVEEFDRVVGEHLDGATRQVTMVPDRFGRGTNIRLFRPGDLLPSMYGKDSAIAYRKAAMSSGIECSVVDSPRMSHDLDQSDDIRALLELSNSRGYPFSLNSLFGSGLRGDDLERLTKCA